MRKSTGVVRPVDHLGRVVIPIELRRTIGLAIGDPVRIDCDLAEGTVVLIPYQPGCVFCGEAGEGQLVLIRGRKVCRKCCEEARKL